MSEPTGQPEPLGYEVAYEMLFATIRSAERTLNEIVLRLEEVKVQLRTAYTAAEETRGPAFTRK